MRLFFTQQTTTNTYVSHRIVVRFQLQHHLKAFVALLTTHRKDLGLITHVARGPGGVCHKGEEKGCMDR